MANNLKTTRLVEACRKMSEIVDEEQPASTYGGSFRYWLKRKMIFGINVAGGRRDPDVGQLDVWIPVPSLAMVTNVPENDIRQVLIKEFNAAVSGKTDCIVGLTSLEETQALVSRVRGWVIGKPSLVGAVS
jgi:hypothetical protein